MFKLLITALLLYFIYLIYRTYSRIKSIAEQQKNKEKPANKSRLEKDDAEIITFREEKSEDK
jgi:hypothetical protein